MAFELVDQRRIVSDGGIAGAPAMPASVSRIVAAGMAIAITSGLLWLALTRLIVVTVPPPLREVNVLQLVTVSEDAPPSPAPTVAVADRPLPPVPEPVSVRVIEPLQPAPEWAVSRIRVPVAVAPSTPVSAPDLVGSKESVAQGPASGSAGSSGYDPYAGATPMRGGPPQAAIQPVVLTAAVDRAMLERVRLMVKRRFPKARGSAMMAVQVSGDGRAVAADLILGDLPSDVVAALADALTTQSRYPASGKPYRLHLPVIVL